MCAREMVHGISLAEDEVAVSVSSIDNMGFFSLPLSPSVGSLVAGGWLLLGPWNLPSRRRSGCECVVDRQYGVVFFTFVTFCRIIGGWWLVVASWLDDWPLQGLVFVFPPVLEVAHASTATSPAIQTNLKFNCWKDILGWQYVLGTLSAWYTHTTSQFRLVSIQSPYFRLHGSIIAIVSCGSLVV